MLFLKNKIKTRFLIILLIVALSISAILIALGFVLKNKQENPDLWVLHSYGNNVALYNGDNIIEVYGSISLDTLPESDKKLLDNGIFFLTREKAQSAIEDYDG
jgi:hypothetical protein